MRFDTFSGLWDFGMGVFAFSFGFGQHIIIALFFHIMGASMMGWGLNKVYDSLRRTNNEL